MPENNHADHELEEFDVEPLFEDRIHQRHAFTFKVQGNKFKGHYHEDQLQWLHPHPKQKIDDRKLAFIEATIHALMGKLGVTSGVQDFQIKQAFEDRLHECQEVTLQIHGKEYKGLVQEGEIQWFHPQPKQNLDDQRVEVIESEIHEKIAMQAKDVAKHETDR